MLSRNHSKISCKVIIKVVFLCSALIAALLTSWCEVESISPSTIINKLTCLLPFLLNSDLRLVYILFLQLKSTSFTAIAGLFFSNLPIFCIANGNVSSCQFYWSLYLSSYNIWWGSLVISSWYNSGIKVQLKHCSSLLLWFITVFFLTIHSSNSSYLLLSPPYKGWCEIAWFDLV